MFLPDFLGIGGNRSGSSWLWTTLRAHPQIWTPETKELHLFDRRMQRPPWKMVGRSPVVARLHYRKIFARSAFQGAVVRGELTPAYSVLSQRDVEWVHRTIPRAKILFIMRDPLERVWSQARKDMFSLIGVTPENAGEADFAEFLALPEVLARMDYATSIARWRRVYGEERVKILFLEECLAEPQQRLAELFEFLGVDPSKYIMPGDILTKKVNIAPPAPLPARFCELALPLIVPFVRRLRRELGERPLPWRDYHTEMAI